MIDSAQFPLEVSGRTVKHSTKDGAKHLPPAANVPNGKVLSALNGQWLPSDVSGVSVSSVFGRTGAVTAQTGDYTPAQVGAEPALSNPASQMLALASLTTGSRRWVEWCPQSAIDIVHASPGSPSDGDTYLTRADHPTAPHAIIRWDAVAAAWITITPSFGWRVALTNPGAGNGPIYGVWTWGHAWTPTLSSTAFGGESAVLTVSLTVPQIQMGSSSGFVKASSGYFSISALSSSEVTAALGYTPIGGSGTTNRIPKFSGSSIADSSISDDGTTVTTSETVAVQNRIVSYKAKSDIRANASRVELLDALSLTKGVSLSLGASGDLQIYHAVPSWGLTASLGSGSWSVEVPFRHVGVVDGSVADTGYSGEYLIAGIDSSGMVNASNGSAVTIVSLSLSPGDWDIEGQATAFITGAMTGNKVVSGINTSVAIPTNGFEVYGGIQVFSSINATQTMTHARRRINVSTTTTVYLVGQVDFSAGSPGLYGFISARRIR